MDGCAEVGARGVYEPLRRVGISVKTMANNKEKKMSDRAAIESVIQTYFDSMFESSSEKAQAAFHPEARITGYLGGDLMNMSVDEFAAFVASQQPSPKEKGDEPRLDIVSVDIAGEVAIAQVRDDYLGHTFLDQLSLMKIDDAWRIQNKLFHVEA